MPNLEMTGGAAMGHASGSDGAVTQITSRTTGMTSNAPSGQITLVSAAGRPSWQTVTVANGADLYEIHVMDVSAGSFDITFATCRDTATFAVGAPLCQARRPGNTRKRRSANRPRRIDRRRSTTSIRP
ncbi:MAG: hypothetical protein AAF982_11485 [Pseudomonadota bacterium]